VYLLIGGYIYTNISPPKSSPLYGKRWEKLPLATLPGSQNGRFGALLSGSPGDQIVNPDDLLAALHSVGQVREIGPASGPGWTGTRYAFTAKLSAITRLRGTVDVDQQGQVRAIEDTMPIMSPPRFGPEKRTITLVAGYRLGSLWANLCTCIRQVPRCLRRLMVSGPGSLAL
jgi:hypothetical protein